MQQAGSGVGTGIRTQVWGVTVPYARPLHHTYPSTSSLPSDPLLPATWMPSRITARPSRCRPSGIRHAQSVCSSRRMAGRSLSPVPPYGRACGTKARGHQASSRRILVFFSFFLFGSQGAGRAVLLVVLCLLSAVRLAFGRCPAITAWRSKVYIISLWCCYNESDIAGSHDRRGYGPPPLRRGL